VLDIDRHACPIVTVIYFGEKADTNFVMKKHSTYTRHQLRQWAWKSTLLVISFMLMQPWASSPFLLFFSFNFHWQGFLCRVALWNCVNIEKIIGPSRTQLPRLLLKDVKSKSSYRK